MKNRFNEVYNLLKADLLQKMEALELAKSTVDEFFKPETAKGRDELKTTLSDEMESVLTDNARRIIENRITDKDGNNVWVFGEHIFSTVRKGCKFESEAILMVCAKLPLEAARHEMKHVRVIDIRTCQDLHGNWEAILTATAKW